MNKKILAVAIAGALSAPSAFAATDTSGMQYTSASEGFYGSIRLRYNSANEGHDNSAADIQNSSSRIGVRGSLDLGGGLEGYYQWELGINDENGENAGSTRVSHVGLRGGWGDLMVGSGWTAHYGMTHGTTDIANVHSGQINYNTLLPGRASSLIQYTSPDLNGFQGAIAVEMDNSGDSAGKDDNDLDTYYLSAKYEVQGFSAAVGYSNDVEGLMVGDALEEAAEAALNTLRGGTGTGTSNSDVNAASDKAEDHTALVYKLGYAQDNWYVNGWYSVDNSGDQPNLTTEAGAAQNTGAALAAGQVIRFDDAERLSLAAGVEVGKVNLYALYEARETTGYGLTGTNASGVKVEDEFTTVGVQYNLGARSRVWVEYAGRDWDSDDKVGDFITIGLRHDF